MSRDWRPKSLTYLGNFPVLSTASHVIKERIRLRKAKDTDKGKVNPQIPLGFVVTDDGLYNKKNINIDTTRVFSSFTLQVYSINSLESK